MQFGVRIAFLLLLVAAAVSVKGVHHRPDRWSGFSLFDRFRNSGDSSLNPKPTKATSEDSKPLKPVGGNGFSLEDALKPGSKPFKPVGGNGFSLEDALKPASKPTDNPTDDQGNVAQKLGKVIEQQNQQLRLLQQLMAKSSSCCLK